MKQIFFSMFLLGIVAAIGGCTQEDVKTEPPLSELYASLSSMPTHSVFDVSGVSTRGALSLPTFNKSDLDYLLSLSIEELQQYRSQYCERMGAEKLAEKEAKRQQNLDRMYGLMGGHDGLDKLKEFGFSYALGVKGWSSIEMIMPEGLSRKQQMAYLAMAVYVDNIARPLYEATATPSSLQTRLQESEFDCRANLLRGLIAAGADCNEADLNLFIEYMQNQANTEADVEPPFELPDEVVAYDLWEMYLSCIGG